ncbi:hypothetical protein N7540_005135 [Penicillium herquei]|nr:hypothetical protein N7540_005135 [Penicillium herquei]
MATNLNPDDEEYPVKNWYDRSRHLPTPDFNPPEFFCDTEVWQDGLLDPNIPKPDVLFKYQAGRRGYSVK